MFITQLNTELDEFHLLKHPFYQDWNMGKLTIDELKVYAGQYFQQVQNFPRYISTIHSKCDDLQARQVLLGNLYDEENGDENHPELWLRFAEGLGAKRDEVTSAKMMEKTHNLVEGFYKLINESYAKGLGALYTYERQVPEVAKSKIEGLKKFYGIDSPKALKFFEVHIGADEWHSQEVEDLISKLSDAERKEVKEGAVRAAKLLWGFLDGMQDYRASTGAFDAQACEAHCAVH